ncbi:5-oxoprolinase subunit PxpA [Planococcus sp. APC 4015]|nr:5-oxoprolinase subunit PxpA [Planococcus sp. APC 4015]
MAAIDMNADLGETVNGVPTADDEAMFAVISSANIACGAHAGDADSMRAAVDRATRFGVAVGAHPSYPDPAGFGRAAMRMPAAELEASVAAQLLALLDAGADLRYVKPHGALYHAVTDRREEARSVVAAVVAVSERLGRGLPLLGMGGEIALAAREAGLGFVGEAFLDRGYRADGSLVPRGGAGALVTDPRQISERALRFARESTVEAVDGTIVHVDAASLCVHGDSPSAVGLARAARAALDDDGIRVRAPW